jgi:hypothetical protein
MDDKLRLKNNSRFAVIFAAVISIFLWKLITMRGSFIAGDHLSQFYPWFKVYAGSIKHFSFPFWTHYMQSGFPLMAEGQVGGYYPLNIAFFASLPFDIAYNYIIVFHFALAGVAAYLLTRKLGACELGGTLAALIFCFGSAYAGGFYNIITLKTLSWTPFVLLLFELFFENKRIGYIVTAGIIFGMQLLAGFIQMAAYCWIFYAVYFLYRSGSLKQILNLMLFSFIAFLLFIPQLLLTYRLVLESSRSAADLQFALWGSYNPAYLVQTIFPYWPQFLKNDLYLSIFGILFMICSSYLLKDDKRIRGVFIVLALSFLLAMGKYNPLYVLAIKTFHLYSLRNPSKFLFFTAMAASILIGRGFSTFVKDGFTHRRDALKIFITILCVCAAAFLASKAVLVVFKDNIIGAGKWYASKYIFGTANHRYDLEYYMKGVNDVYQAAVNGVSFNNVFNITSWLLLVFALIASLYVIKKRALRVNAYLKYAIVAVVVLDLFVYSFIGKGFRSNIRDYNTLKPTDERVYDYIKEDKDIFRVLPYGVGSGKLPFWIMPNTNMLYGIDSVAAYTPLANGYYRKALLPLEAIDDSLGVRPPEKGSISTCMAQLRLLNTKYIVSYCELDDAGLAFIMKDSGTYLYRLNNTLPRVFVAKKLDLDTVDSNIKVKMIEYDSGKAVMSVDMPYNGFLVFSENDYPRWRVSVNGRSKQLVSFSLVGAVELDKGENTVSLMYEPY